MKKEKIYLLEKIPMWNWSSSKKENEESWNNAYNLLKIYINENKKLCSRNYISDDGFKLGFWLSNQKSLQKKDKLTKTKIKLLEELKPFWKWS